MGTRKGALMGPLIGFLRREYFYIRREEERLERINQGGLGRKKPQKLTQEQIDEIRRSIYTQEDDYERSKNS